MLSAADVADTLNMFLVRKSLVGPCVLKPTDDDSSSFWCILVMTDEVS